MSSKLSSLVEATKNPAVLLYVWTHLGVGVPNDACFRDTITNIRHKVVRRMLNQPEHPAHAAQHVMVIQMRQQFVQQMLVNFQHFRAQRQQMEMIEDQATENLLQIQEKQISTLLFQQANLNQFITKLAEGSPDFLREQLRSMDPLARLLTILTIGKRRVHLEKELIDQLNDPNPTIRNAVHWSLLRVTRGTDFGPFPATTRRGMDRSMGKWRDWLSLQQSESAEMLAKVAAPDEQGKLARAAVPNVGPLLLTHEEWPVLSEGVAKACDELLKARRGADNDTIELLALAIPQLTGSLQEDARDTLTERLARLPAAALRDKLQDDRMEVRCAAALACGRQLLKEHVRDLIPLLDDPERDVVQSARAALTELTGEDFGPSRDADRRGRDKALAAWRDWAKLSTELRK